MTGGLSVLVCLPGDQPESVEACAHAARLAEAGGAAWGALRIVASSGTAGAAAASMDLAHRLGGATLACRAVDDGAAAMADAVLRVTGGRAPTRLLVPEHGAAAKALYDALVFRCAERWPAVQVEWLPAPAPGPQPPAARRWGPVAGTSAVLAACVVVNELLRGWLDPGSGLMVYLAGVVVVSVYLGRGAGLACAAGGVLLFDLLLVPPRWALVPLEPRHWATIGLMALVGWLIGGLAGGLRTQRLGVQAWAARMQLLNDTSGALGTAPSPQAVGEVLCAAIRERMGTQAALMLPPGDDGGPWRLAAGEPGLADPRGLEAARVEARETGHGTVSQPMLAARHVPLQADGPVLAVLVLGPLPPARATPQDWRLLRAMAAQAASALERLRLGAVGAAAALAGESERLRNTLLAGISHDLSAPLTTIVGVASSLHEQHDALSPAVRRALLDDLLTEARHMHRTLTNLLELTRLESGAPRLAAEWYPADDLIATTLQPRAARLATHRVETEVPPALFVWCDPRLMGQLLGNLLDNVAAHTPAGTRVRIAAARRAQELHLVVHDDGPGLPPGREAALFGKFVRGDAEPSHGGSPGLGLGLAICAAVARLHGGRLTAGNDRGARFALVMPQPALGPPTECA